MTVAVERTEFRCRGKIHGVKKAYPNGEVYLEVRCKDHWCTEREPNTVVFHYYDWETGEMHHTQKYSNPPSQSGQLESNSNER